MPENPQGGITGQYELVAQPYDPAQVPVGWDRADGLEDRPGTPTPAGSIIISGAATDDAEGVAFEELPDSPTFERAEQATITHRFRCSFVEGLNRIQYIGRGTIWTDSYGWIWKILSSTLENKGNYAFLTTVAESMSFDPPMDEFSVTPVEMGLNILKHPRYMYAFLGNTEDERMVNQHVIRRLQDYFDNPSAPFRDAIVDELKKSMTHTGTKNSKATPLKPMPDSTWTGSGDTPGTDICKAAAIEIVQKYWRNEETPYIVGWQVDWKRYYWRPQYPHPGGVIENPFDPEADTVLPDYFALTEDGGLLLDALAQLNPQNYSSDGTAAGTSVISCLRKADRIDHQRTWFAISRTWLISSVGHWDQDFYGKQNRPARKEDYHEASAYTTL